ncbi:hypothetical protein ACLI4U_02775 [Natrialbaceae archaeon A-CW2]
MLSNEDSDRLEAACSETVGQALRSIVYFTEDDFEQVHLSDYLSAEADIAAFVDNEREGFHRVSTHEGSELGRYEYTIRRFERGYLVRVISDSKGVFVTTNQLPTEEFDELASAVERVMKTWNE